MDLYVIHLEDRKDRFEKIKQYYSSYNIIPILAIQNENGRIGCFLSHQKCIRLAKESNMNYICVLEDDCVPIGSSNNLLEMKDFLDNNDWNLFIGGVQVYGIIIFLEKSLILNMICSKLLKLKQLI